MVALTGNGVVVKFSAFRAATARLVALVALTVLGAGVVVGGADVVERKVVVGGSGGGLACVVAGVDEPESVL